MTVRTVLLDDLEGRPVAELLQEVARRRETLTVVLAGGESVQIRPSPAPLPLPELEGAIPLGWKDAVYGR